MKYLILICAIFIGGCALTPIPRVECGSITQNKYGTWCDGNECVPNTNSCIKNVCSCQLTIKENLNE